MILFPAVDILNGQSVRLLHGNFDKVTVYGDPVEMARKWADQGAEYLHIVDLNGAREGKSVNLSAIERIVRSVKIPVQLGGGIRTMSDIAERLDSGVKRVILGTVCCKDPEIVKQAVDKFGAERIVAGIDAKDGKVAVHGWEESSDLSPYELGKKMYSFGLRYAVFTDISRDGALTGVNTDSCVKMAQTTGLNVIASGGVSSPDDLKALKAKNLYGAILGKALYEKKFDVKEATEIVK